jgi:hypothetical protein
VTGRKPVWPKSSDPSAPKGRHLNLGHLRIWWTLSCDRTYVYLPDGTSVAGYRRNAPMWYTDY